ncbi:MAG: diguanylate cyclase [Anaerolineae bacterium]|nr:diguanylate cyclase [Anaerolineae bacterium]MCI0607497.1 diguanylate cyclase [Anaerolineae bacterium]
MDDHHLSVERIDALMGCGNLLSFLELFSHRFSSNSYSAFSLLLVDLNNFMKFNKEHGHEQGDAVLHWVSIVLKDTGLPVYRIGGDEVIVVLTGGTPQEKENLARDVFSRLNRESAQFEWSNPASVMLIHFGNERFEIADLWIAISDVLQDAKVEVGHGFLVNHYTRETSENNYQIGVINTLTERLLSFASRLEASNQLAYLDPNTQLPNSLAAEKEIERTLQQAHDTDGNFSILFIDGDNLRLYNDISYSAGDEMIRNLANTLSQHLRPGDFLARWRVGDEFFVILPDTPSDKALHVAERLRAAVENESKTWRIPVSVSIGMADYPARGTSIRDLLDAVEKSAKQAKDNGKNQVVYL